MHILNACPFGYWKTVMYLSPAASICMHILRILHVVIFSPAPSICMHILYILRIVIFSPAPSICMHILHILHIVCFSLVPSICMHTLWENSAPWRSWSEPWWDLISSLIWTFSKSKMCQKYQGSLTWLDIQVPLGVIRLPWRIGSSRPVTDPWVVRARQGLGWILGVRYQGTLMPLISFQAGFTYKSLALIIPEI